VRRYFVLCRVNFPGSVNVIRLEEDNKEEELVDVAPHWGEPRTSCVVIDLCY
jgi:hypothetical protein